MVYDSTVGFTIIIMYTSIAVLCRPYMYIQTVPIKIFIRSAIWKGNGRVKKDSKLF